jgi:hypothetical protein
MFEFLTAMLLEIQVCLDLTLRGCVRMTILTTRLLILCHIGVDLILVQILFFSYVICIRVACVSVGFSNKLFHCTIMKSSEAVVDLTRNSMRFESE